ncbi:MAG: hypothetical protein OEY01_09490 [Desulfobulbaceae bacterium]|nr:hypothetical protein [Desulfobulbaceae bacterium]HIJ79236.1 hypothetical protein [Deltaproteobacteria bacterium]
MEFESKLVPIMREGVEIIKMIFFKHLKDSISKRYPAQDATYCNLLTGGVVNELFGTRNPEEPFASFNQKNRRSIDEELGRIAADFSELRIPLTDGLRMQALCDHQDGCPETDTLDKAQGLGILIADRDLPLPHNFIQLVRKLGQAFGLVIPPQPFEQSSPPEMI